LSQRIRTELDLDARWPRIRTLMARYDRVDLADTSLVEIHKRCQVMTIDRRDFSTYCRNDRPSGDPVHRAACGPRR
jgi:hypothetical protein